MITAAAFKASEAAGLAKVITELKALSVEKLIPGILNSIFSETHYTEATKIAKIILARHGEICNLNGTGGAMCTEFEIILGTKNAQGQLIGAPAYQAIPKKVGEVVEGAKVAAAEAAKIAEAAEIAKIKAAQEKAIETTFMGNQTIIIASVIAIVVIVLIMVIIYLILRYRRKKKMKKKLQYIKLLEE
ncbi:hypothetical protein PFFCH_03265 [Plasmodium falciparum FCH/4]|uniref:Surface antigen n=1 Tax=Plasmodium falciparum FCH/4 TaxID=1036724 RepID=A0A024VKR1_PLAFA|nr:hypothetical protein PFFCH_03265 [Plasmodium falciparum FCH/4]